MGIMGAPEGAAIMSTASASGSIGSMERSESVTVLSPTATRIASAPPVCFEVGPAPETAFQLITKGSVHHCNGTCKPCAFFHRSPKGCLSGVDCTFCHLCGPDEIKRRKNLKQKVRKMHADYPSLFEESGEKSLSELLAQGNLDSVVRSLEEAIGERGLTRVKGSKGHSRPKGRNMQTGGKQKQANTFHSRRPAPRDRSVFPPQHYEEFVAPVVHIAGTGGNKGWQVQQQQTAGWSSRGVVFVDGDQQWSSVGGQAYNQPSLANVSQSSVSFLTGAAAAAPQRLAAPSPVEGSSVGGLSSYVQQAHAMAQCVQSDSGVSGGRLLPHLAVAGSSGGLAPQQSGQLEQRVSGTAPKWESLTGSVRSSVADTVQQQDGGNSPNSPSKAARIFSLLESLARR